MGCRVKVEFFNSDTALWPFKFEEAEGGEEVTYVVRFQLNHRYDAFWEDTTYDEDGLRSRIKVAESKVAEPKCYPTDYVPLRSLERGLKALFSKNKGSNPELSSGVKVSLPSPGF